MRLTNRVGRRLAFALTASILGVLALSAVPALAAAPETPTILPPPEVHAESAMFAGVLNPGKVGEPGTYEKDEYDFLYNASKTQCKGGGVAPGAPLESQGGGEEPVALTVEGLTKGTEYTVCLQVIGGGSEAVSAPVTFTTTIPPEEPTGVEAKPIAATTATLRAVLNAAAKGDPGSYEFHYRQSPGECQGENEKTVSGKSTGASPEPIAAPVSGLLPNMPYTLCVSATNEVGEAILGAPVTFMTLVGPPTIASESVAGVEATTATLEAEIEPDGAETTYHFEYGISAYEHSTPEAVVAGTSDNEQAATAHITGLLPGTRYHYRVVATNSQSPAGGTPGLDKEMTTLEAPSAAVETCGNAQQRAEQAFGRVLPDCRAYEMVSPVETNGQDATDTAVASGPRASLSGEAIAYVSLGGFGEPPGETAENQLISRRGPTEWTTQAVTPPHEPQGADSYPSFEADAFTPELTAGVANSNEVLGAGAPTLEPGEKNLYFTEFGSGTYRYLGQATVPMGASEDFSHVVFGESGGISEWVDGTVYPVSVANDETSMPASVGSTSSGISRGRDKDAWHAVSSGPSAEGTRVYFTSPGVLEGQLYVRVNPEQHQSPMNGEECTVASDACTIEVSASQRTSPDPHGPRPARYWGASTDGEKVFFTSNAELTDDAYTGTEDNAANLYEYDLLSGELTDLTVDSADVEDGADVQGVVQISEDGSYVYFVADGVLAGNAVARKPNLYVSHDGGSPTFIATLSENDLTDWGYHGVAPEDEPSPAINSAVLTPDGAQIAFISEESLRGYDNTQSHPHECEGEIGSAGERETGKCREIFTYDTNTAELVCVSCNPTGARPVGSSNLSELGSHFPVTEYRARSFLENGTLFFNSSDALIPRASDGRQNVYEYENGHVHAISEVSGASPSFFLDASPTGRDVFFATADALVPQDTGTNVVVYDARVGGGFPAPTSPSSCPSGDACKPPPAPQSSVFGPPASGTFSGPGNLSPAPTAVTPKKTAAQLRAEKLRKALKLCRKDKSKKKRAACEKSARKKFGVSKAKKASTKRRASR